MVIGKRGKAGNENKGRSFNKSVWDCWAWVFRVNEFLIERMPLTIPRTDEELAEFMRYEYQDGNIRDDTVRHYRTDFNKGKLTQGNCPEFISEEWKGNNESD